MNLIIEQGNSRTKVAVYEGCTHIVTTSFKAIGIADLETFFTNYNLTAGIFSSVVDDNEELISYLKKRLNPFIILDDKTPLPIKVNYETPESLGHDRIAAAVGANFLRPGCNVLVIDAGTCITYDMVEASGEFVGGNISLGMSVRFKALHEYTCHLPLVASGELDIPLVGKDTESAIRGGIVKGIIFEMDGYINELRAKYPNLLVFLTGGHSFYFESRLKNAIFADSNLVVAGLNKILEYNTQLKPDKTLNFSSKKKSKK